MLVLPIYWSDIGVDKCGVVRGLKGRCDEYDQQESWVLLSCLVYNSPSVPLGHAYDAVICTIALINERESQILLML